MTFKMDSLHFMPQVCQVCLPVFHLPVLMNSGSRTNNNMEEIWSKVESIEFPLVPAVVKMHGRVLMGRVYWSLHGNSLSAFPPTQEVQRSGSANEQRHCSWHGYGVSAQIISPRRKLVNMDTASVSFREKIAHLTSRSVLSKPGDPEMSVWVRSKMIPTEFKLTFFHVSALIGVCGDLKNENTSLFPQDRSS